MFDPGYLFLLAYCEVCVHAECFFKGEGNKEMYLARLRKALEPLLMSLGPCCYSVFERVHQIHIVAQQQGHPASVSSAACSQLAMVLTQVLQNFASASCCSSHSQRPNSSFAGHVTGPLSSRSVLLNLNQADHGQMYCPSMLCFMDMH